MVIKRKLNLIIILFISFTALCLSCFNETESIEVKNWQILYREEGPL